MPETGSDVFTSAVAQLLTEAYEGTSGQSWFSDSGPDSGLFATLAAGHLRWSLAMANAMMRGEQVSRNWAESWSVIDVTNVQWAEVQAELKQEYEVLKQSLPPQPDLSNSVFVTSGMALVAHAAYHLGAVRQLVLSSKVY